MEGFLQFCAEDNLQVVTASTPAQYFHVLRRQMHGGADRRGVRKPLIIFTPKRMFRHPKAGSTIDERMSAAFHEMLDDPGAIDPARGTRVLVCSGQSYYDLVAAGGARN